MKSLLLFGGLLGFALGLMVSWAQECAWPTCLWHASLAAYVTGFLMRWWGGAWRRNLAAALQERQSAASPATTPASLLAKAK